MSIITDVIAGVLSPLSSWLNKREHVSLEKYKVDGKVDVEAVKAAVEALKARRDLHMEYSKYIGFRVVMYGFMVPLAVWWNAIIAYCILHPWFPWWEKVLALPDNLQYISAGIIAFLFLYSKDQRRQQ